MFRLGTHFDISEIKIEDGYIVGKAKNVGSFNVETVRIVAYLKKRWKLQRNNNPPGPARSRSWR